MENKCPWSVPELVLLSVELTDFGTTGDIEDVAHGYSS